MNGPGGLHRTLKFISNYYFITSQTLKKLPAGSKLKFEKVKYLATKYAVKCVCDLPKICNNHMYRTSTVRIMLTCSGNCLIRNSLQFLWNACEEGGWKGPELLSKIIVYMQQYVHLKSTKILRKGELLLTRELTFYHCMKAYFLKLEMGTSVLEFEKGFFLLNFYRNSFLDKRIWTFPFKDLPGSLLNLTVQMSRTLVYLIAT